jgi:transmembrane sensor
MTGQRTLTKAERQASAWIVRMNAHDVSDKDRQAFEAWLIADPAHARAYAALRRTWEAIANNPNLKGRVGAEAARSASARGKTAPALAIAAAAALAIGGAAWLTNQTSETAQHIETAPGSLRTITMADGSTIELSGASEATLRTSDRERRVVLAQGYALFDVTHDPNRPFLVETPQGEIRVLGTAFVVHVGQHAVRTTVLRGSVSGAAERAGLLSVFGPRQTVTAEANQEIVLDGEGASIVPIAAETIPRRLAWQDGMLAFDGETLDEAIAEVSRQTGWRFDLDDAELGRMRVAGYVSAEPEAFLSLLQSSLGLNARRIEARHVALSRAARAE